jgi:hypothetical protein
MQACLSSRHPHVQCLALDDAAIAERCAERGLPVWPMPPNEAPDHEHQAWLAWLLRDVLALQPDAMFSSEAYGLPCAQTLSKTFGKPVASVPGDPARRTVQVSATAIRRDAEACRGWLSPPVWADFVPRLVLLGGESCGKTTLARAWPRTVGTRAWPSHRARFAARCT